MDDIHRSIHRVEELEEEVEEFHPSRRREKRTDERKTTYRSRDWRLISCKRKVWRRPPCSCVSWLLSPPLPFPRLASPSPLPFLSHKSKLPLLALHPTLSPLSTAHRPLVPNSSVSPRTGRIQCAVLRSCRVVFFLFFLDRCNWHRGCFAYCGVCWFSFLFCSLTDLCSSISGKSLLPWILRVPLD
jgi:hypothetical protein